MSLRVTVVDYGSGNLLSVCRALRHCGADVVSVETAAEIAAADRPVVPGVGAMADSMHGLRERNLIEPIQQYAERERPFLGICVGMQVMFETSEEFDDHQGLGLIPGQVRRLPKLGDDGRTRKIPHIGWNTLILACGVNDWNGTILAGLPPEPSAYFLHSYGVEPDDESSLTKESGSVPRSAEAHSMDANSIRRRAATSAWRSSGTFSRFERRWLVPELR